MVRQRSSDGQLGKSEYINEFIDDDEDEYKDYISTQSKHNKAKNSKIDKVEKEVVNFFEKIG